MADETRILVYGGTPLIDLFAVPLSAAGKVETFSGQKAGKHDLLVLDAGSLSAADFHKASHAAKASLDANKPVLVLTPNENHKAVLAAAGALHTYPTSPSVALLIEPRRDKNGRLRLWLAEQYAPVGGHMVRTTGSGRKDAGDEVSDSFEGATRSLPTITEIEKFVQRVRSAVTGLQSGQLTADSSNGPSNPPANIPAGLYDVTPVNLYYALVAAGSASNGYTPPTGSLTFEGVAYIGVYYDNTSFNTPVQWLLIENSGLYYTAGLEANDSTHIGWSIGELAINGQSISGPSLATKQSSPNNVNGQTTYESSTSFSVGLSAGTDGLSANASYTIGSSVSNSVSDWGIVQSAPNVWQFAQATPYNGATPPGSFPSGAAGSDGVASLPAISIGSFAYNAQTVWQQLPATNVNGSVSYGFYLQAFFTYSSETGKSWSASCWNYNWNISQNWSLNWASAWPSS
jgi:hypothetical protein